MTERQERETAVEPVVAAGGQDSIHIDFAEQTRILRNDGLGTQDNLRAAGASFTNTGNTPGRGARHSSETHLVGKNFRTGAAGAGLVFS